MITLIFEQKNNKIHIKYITLNKNEFLSLCDKEINRATSTTVGIDLAVNIFCKKCFDVYVKRQKGFSGIFYFKNNNFRHILGGLRSLKRNTQGVKSTMLPNFSGRKMRILKSKIFRKSKFHE